MKTALDRFSEKYTINAYTGCWEWKAAMFIGGYGMFYEGTLDGTKGRTMKAHRWSYEYFVGPIPEGLSIDHLCRVRHCVNPRHLEAVPMVVNTSRAPTSPSTINRGKTHCKRGHPLSGDNLYNVPGRNIRNCKICKTLKMQEYRAARVASGLTTRGTTRKA